MHKNNKNKTIILYFLKKIILRSINQNCFLSFPTQTITQYGGRLTSALDKHVSTVIVVGAKQGAVDWASTEGSQVKQQKQQHSELQVVDAKWISDSVGKWLEKQENENQDKDVDMDASDKSSTPKPLPTTGYEIQL